MLQRGFEEVETSFVCALVEFTVVSFGFEFCSLLEVDGWHHEKGAVIAIALRRKRTSFRIAMYVPLFLGWCADSGRKCVELRIFFSRLIDSLFSREFKFIPWFPRLHRRCISGD